MCTTTCLLLPRAKGSEAAEWCFMTPCLCSFWRLGEASRSVGPKSQHAFAPSTYHRKPAEYRKQESCACGSFFETLHTAYETKSAALFSAIPTSRSTHVVHLLRSTQLHEPLHVLSLLAPRRRGNLRCFFSVRSAAYRLKQATHGVLEAEGRQSSRL